MDEMLSSFKQEPWMQLFLLNGDNWVNIVQNLKAGIQIDDSIIFFEETFNTWAIRLLKAD
jgi:hypothetical protein